MPLCESGAELILNRRRQAQDQGTVTRTEPEVAAPRRLGIVVSGAAPKLSLSLSLILAQDMASRSFWLLACAHSENARPRWLIIAGDHVLRADAKRLGLAQVQRCSCSKISSPARPHLPWDGVKQERGEGMEIGSQTDVSSTGGFQ